MGDRSYQSIRLGGVVSDRSVLKGLVRALGDDDVCEDWDAELSYEDIAKRLLAGESFFTDPYGTTSFEHTKTFCNANGIAYSHSDEGCPGCWDPFLELLIPGVGEFTFGCAEGYDVPLYLINLWIERGELSENIAMLNRLKNEFPKFEIDSGLKLLLDIDPEGLVTEIEEDE